MEKRHIPPLSFFSFFRLLEPFCFFSFFFPEGTRKKIERVRKLHLSPPFFSPFFFPSASLRLQGAGALRVSFSSAGAREESGKFSPFFPPPLFFPSFSSRWIPQLFLFPSHQALKKAPVLSFFFFSLLPDYDPFFHSFFFPPYRRGM